MPAKRQGQKPILFRKIESEPVTRESLKDELESLQFSCFWPNAYCMLENMGYDLMKSSGLNFGQGKRTLLRSLFQKGWPLTTVIKLGGG